MLLVTVVISLLLSAPRAFAQAPPPLPIGIGAQIPTAPPVVVAPAPPPPVVLLPALPPSGLPSPFAPPGVPSAALPGIGAQIPTAPVLTPPVVLPPPLPPPGLNPIYESGTTLPPNIAAANLNTYSNLRLVSCEAVNTQTYQRYTQLETRMGEFASDHDIQAKALDQCKRDSGNRPERCQMSVRSCWLN